MLSFDDMLFTQLTKLIQIQSNNRYTIMTQLFS